MTSPPSTRLTILVRLRPKPPEATASSRRDASTDVNYHMVHDTGQIRLKEQVHERHTQAPTIIRGIIRQTHRQQGIANCGHLLDGLGLDLEVFQIDAVHVHGHGADLLKGGADGLAVLGQHQHLSPPVSYHYNIPDLDKKNQYQSKTKADRNAAQQVQP